MCTQSQTTGLVMFTVLLVSLPPSDACYLPGTASRSGNRCVCKPHISGDECNRVTHLFPNGRILFQAILGNIKWRDAEKTCEDSGLYFATPWSIEDNTIMYNLFKNFSNRCAIGISNANNTKEWRYVAGVRKGRLLWYDMWYGSPQNNYYTNWRYDQPDNARGREDSGQIWIDASGSVTWNDIPSDFSSDCILCEGRQIPTNSLTLSNTLSITKSRSESLSASGSLSESLTLSPTPSPTVSPTPSRTVSASSSPTPTKALTETFYHLIGQCSEVTSAPKPTHITASNLFTNGVVFEFAVSRPFVIDGEELMVVVQGLLQGVENSLSLIVAKCHTIPQSGVHDRYTCRFPPPPTSLPTGNISSILLRYMPNPGTYCPLGIATVLHPPKRAAANVSAVGASALVCPVMTNGLMDGNVYLIAATSPCATEESQQGGKVATYIIAPLSVFGHAAGLFGNIFMVVLCWLVGFGVIYMGKRAEWKIITEHPILKVPVGFRATLFGMGFWLAELTYPGVVVGTFGLIRAGDSSNIGLGAVGCVYLVLVPVMAVVVMGPLRRPYVTYEEVNVGSLQLGYGMCQSLLTPRGMWGGTGPALGPVTQPFAGIRKAAWCAPLPYIVMTVVGGVLHGMGPGTACVARLATVTVLLFVVGVAIAVTRPFRYHINSLLYNITFGLLAMYTALLTISASRHDVRQRTGRAMGSVQLVIGVSLLLVFLVRGVVFVLIVIKEGSINRPGRLNDNREYDEL